MILKNSKGFSLIELSIVLIIIGLLVAGITGGASLIRSAELRAVISEIRNYQTAINAYYTAVGELPGGVDSDQMEFSETGVAWHDLYEEGITDIDPTTTTTGATSLDSDYGIDSKIKGSFYVLGYNEGAMDQNVIFLISDGGTGGTAETVTDLEDIGDTVTTLTNPSITRRDANFLDSKMDNGVIDSGRVYSFNAGTGTCSYSTTDTTKDCVIAIGIGL
ncbi:MAG TPA: type II secretion system protein [Rickettsiales bacterium]|nr:type II secretion system protein [Rickettsiales bacterium]